MSRSKFSTTIIAGKYKGKRLTLPSLEITRSSKSRLKESLFNVLQFDIVNSTFIEAFGGSGSVGLEALSRGAKESVFIEKDRGVYDVLVGNCKFIDSRSCQTYLGDTFDLLPTLLEQFKHRADVVLYLDPPFDFRDGMTQVYEKSFKMVELLTNRNVSLVVFEHSSTLEMPKKLGQFGLKRSKKFGKSTLSYYKIELI